MPMSRHESIVNIHMHESVIAKLVFQARKSSWVSVAETLVHRSKLSESHLAYTQTGQFNILLLSERLSS